MAKNTRKEGLVFIRDKFTTKNPVEVRLRGDQAFIESKTGLVRLYVEHPFLRDKNGDILTDDSGNQLKDMNRPFISAHPAEKREYQTAEQVELTI